MPIGDSLEVILMHVAPSKTRTAQVNLRGSNILALYIYFICSIKEK